MDFYLILGVERNASSGDIKRAYRRLARRYHPDVNPGDGRAGARFQRILEAYETLNDPELRRRYDVSGPTASPVAEGAFGFQGFDFSPGGGSQPASSFGDLFGDILRRRGQSRGRQAVERGADLHQTIAVDFESAVHGGPRELTVTRFESCTACGGTGRVAASTERRCPYCQGNGSTVSTRGHMIFSRPCVHCGGSGREAEAVCPTCGGQQGRMCTEALVVNLPAGLADGAQVRLPGRGHGGRGGGSAGDLYVVVRAESHPLFRREGDDAHVTVPIAVHEAALGARIDVPSIDGTARIRIPPGTQSGRRFRLRERGFPSARDGRRGDLVVEVHLMLPEVLDERSKELLREFGRINSGDPRKALVAANRGATR